MTNLKYGHSRWKYTDDIILWCDSDSVHVPGRAGGGWDDEPEEPLTGVPPQPHAADLPLLSGSHSHSSKSAASSSEDTSDRWVLNQYLSMMIMTKLLFSADSSWKLLT